jgi:hypothetical protein
MAAPDETDWQQVAEDCRWVMAEVERKATLAGVPKAVAACQVQGVMTSVEETRRILAECLAACPPEPLTRHAHTTRGRQATIGIVRYRSGLEGFIE